MNNKFSTSKGANRTRSSICGWNTDKKVMGVQRKLLELGAKREKRFRKIRQHILWTWLQVGYATFDARAEVVIGE